MDFGDAIRALKTGKRVARGGWNGKGMWLSLSGMPHQTRLVSHRDFWSEHNAAFAAMQPDGMARVLPSVTMRTADGAILMGWLASQSDMLAEDWEIVP